MVNKLGEIRLRIMRVMQYFSILTFAGVVTANVALWGLPWWVALFAVPFLLLVYWFDGKYAVRSEVQFLNDHNDDLKKLIALTEEIYDTLHR